MKSIQERKDNDFLDHIDKSVKRILSPTAFLGAAYIMLEVSGDNPAPAQWLTIGITILAGIMLLLKVLEVFFRGTRKLLKDNTLFERLTVVTYSFGYLSVVISIFVVTINRASKAIT